jgi:hypothetical protein
MKLKDIKKLGYEDKVKLKSTEELIYGNCEISFAKKFGGTIQYIDKIDFDNRTLFNMNGDCFKFSYIKSAKSKITLTELLQSNQKIIISTAYKYIDSCLYLVDKYKDLAFEYGDVECYITKQSTDEYYNKLGMNWHDFYWDTNFDIRDVIVYDFEDFIKDR